MEIAKTERDGVVVVSIAGRLDANTSPTIDKELEDIAAEGAKILFTLDDLEYISSAGLRVLLVIAKKVRANSGKLCLTGLAENVRDVFEVSGFSSILDVYPTEDEAIEMLLEE